VASDLGYQVTFVTEATATNPIAHRDAPPERTVEELQVLRVERAEHLIGHGATVEAAARMVGFADARMLRRLRSREDAGLRPPALAFPTPTGSG
jgi:hypothetical protein